MNRALLKKIGDYLAPPPIQMTDEYIERLLCTVPGMLDRGNIYCFDHALRNIGEDQAVVEIGSFSGQSVTVISYLLSRMERTNPIFCCDSWRYEGFRDNEQFEDPAAYRDYMEYVGGNRMLSRKEYLAFVKESFIRNISTFSRHNLPGSVDTSSDDFFRQWGEGAEIVDLFGRTIRLGGEIGFCYIDGDHSYGAARRDFENADRYLATGGFILLDDSADGLPFGSARLARELAGESRYELVVKNPHYLFRKR